MFHLPPQNWLYTTPILAVSIANIWRGTAFSMLVYSAALSEVPRDLEEAALVDGAGRFRLLISVTIPLVRRTIATNLMLITLQTLSVFGLIYTMTKGGPSEKSMTLPLFAYNAGLRLRRPRLRHRDRPAAAGDRRDLLGHLSPRPQQVGADPMTAAVTAQAGTAAPPLTVSDAADDHGCRAGCRPA